MSYLILSYCVGVFVTLVVYKRYYRNTISLFEMSVTWFYQLPVMIIEHRKHLKTEQDLADRKAEIWNKEFQAAYKLSKLENWTDADWQRWNDSTDNAISLIIR